MTISAIETISTSGKHSFQGSTSLRVDVCATEREFIPAVPKKFVPFLGSPDIIQCRSTLAGLRLVPERSPIMPEEGSNLAKLKEFLRKFSPATVDRTGARPF